jgi:hypothetical protein
MNHIQKTLTSLNEMSHKAFVDIVKKKCTCGNEKSLNASEHKRVCPCRKSLAFFAESIFTEGASKRAFEAKVEKACNCDGGASLDADEHETTCPAYKMIIDGDFSSDDMDKADYNQER